MNIFGDSLLVCNEEITYYKISFTNEPKLQFVKTLTVEVPGSSEIFRGYQVTQDMDGSLWVITTKPNLYQLWRINATGKNQFIHQVEGQNCLLVDDDKLWIGNWGGTVGIWLYKIIRQRDSVLLKLIKEFDQLPGNTIRSFCKDKYGNVWAGTRNAGLLQFIAKPGGEYIVQHFTKKDGLKGNWIRNIRHSKSVELLW
jgi:ligand-binding sensor domain-containing protein